MTQADVQTPAPLQCLLCASKRPSVKTAIEKGLCCHDCSAGIDKALRRIVYNGDIAATMPLARDINNGSKIQSATINLELAEPDEHQTPMNKRWLTSDASSGISAPGAPAFGSRPPTDLDTVAPYMTLMDGKDIDEQDRRTVATTLSQWNHYLRQAHPAISETFDDWLATQQQTGISFQATLARSSVALLRKHHAWLINYLSADHLLLYRNDIHACARTMSAVSRTASGDRSRQRIVPCPKITSRPGQARKDGKPADAIPVLDEEGKLIRCGTPLTVQTWAPLHADQTEDGRADYTIGEKVTCPRCNTDWTVTELMLAKQGADDDFARAEDIAAVLPITARTIRRWASHGHVRRTKDGRYSWSDVNAIVNGVATRGGNAGA